MAAYSQCTSSVPQGFSIYQAAPGAQLEFFPPIGTQQLDDLIHAYLPGSASIQEKRASVTIDFLTHIQVTGNAFKFYTVPPVVESPALTDSLSFSSHSGSPVASSWDFSQLSVCPSVPSPSSHGRESRKASVAPAGSRQQNADFSHLPGMRIMTRDGLDVTESASRGVKTKEQRDHAHLMRVIKACDSCRRKKTRCEPSHKKRGAAVQTPAQTPAKTIKKVKPAPQPRISVPPSIFNDDLSVPATQLDLAQPYLFADGFEDLAMPELSEKAWEELFAQPQLIAPDYDFSLSDDYYSPQTSMYSATSSSASPGAFASSSREMSRSASAALPTTSALQSTSPQLPFLDEAASSSANNYLDFNLYSPASSFSEDERMLSVRSSSSSNNGARQAESPWSALSPGHDVALAEEYAGFESSARGAVSASSASSVGGVAHENECSVLLRNTHFGLDRWGVGTQASPGTLGLDGLGATNAALIRANESVATIPFYHHPSPPRVMPMPTPEEGSSTVLTESSVQSVIRGSSITTTSDPITAHVASLHNASSRPIISTDEGTLFSTIAPGLDAPARLRTASAPLSSRILSGSASEFAENELLRPIIASETVTSRLQQLPTSSLSALTEENAIPDTGAPTTVASGALGPNNDLFVSLKVAIMILGVAHMGSARALILLALVLMGTSFGFIPMNYFAERHCSSPGSKLISAPPSNSCTSASNHSATCCGTWPTKPLQRTLQMARELNIYGRSVGRFLVC
ncbi:hypothetical protein S40285_01846 [Stachybotrys chlorohalonatus IBT 40285]|uniref:Zn(2)-C6 fungal-type domain-containing protein n=1 Tax=Stachybotrys chlorohalonatus (strain IBT 40285) TaxID=1283841 RepID=A0A084QHA1_STAC4|nr:hypothetical protein S40285_01846 [Stachybotrys chlorohalonata IBT 40285]